MDDPTLPMVAARSEPPPPAARLKRWLQRALVAAVAGAVFAGLLGVVVVAVLSRDLPTLNSLNDYQPKQATVVFGPQGQVVARFASERRTVVEMRQIPEVLVDAVIAAEDADFFQHEGLDYVGMLRCMLKNVFSGRISCGASTITQQTVKTFLLSSEQTVGRKLREMILAKRVEEALKKEEILYLYLNQIFFGHSAYGVQEGARVYFGKNVSGLRLEEAALLAGLPQSPARLDPYRHPERALARRAYVLGQMRAKGKIDEAAYQRAVSAPLALDWNQAEGDLDNTNHYAAHVRNLLELLVGKERATEDGLKVYTGLDPELQRAAERAVRDGLRELDKRQGWRGPILHLEPNEAAELTKRLEARREKVASAQETRSSTQSAGSGPVIWDLSGAALGDDQEKVEAILERTRFSRFEYGRVVAGLVVQVDDAGKAAVVHLGGGVDVHLPLKTGLSWARPFDISRGTRAPRAPSDVLRVGDVVQVRPTGPRRSDGKKGAEEGGPSAVGVLEQRPKAEAALVAIDPHSREVRALVGGYGAGQGAFNRAVQARRQAGSTFKPVVYAAAFETSEYTPISVCLDAPRVYRDPWTGKSWKPENYGGDFSGEISLRTALTLSKNLCSVELIDKIGVDHVLEVAARVGVQSPLPKNLTLALGSGDVTPLEMTNVYATFVTGGVFAEPAFITKVLAKDESPLFERKLDTKNALRPEVAYQVTSLMQSVVEAGTAQRVKSLERPVAGKTGTSNEARNAWFVGFTPDLVVGVWVGFDNNDPLGPLETGGRAAIPIWLSMMEVAIKRTPPRDFVAPAGIVFAHVDPKSGKLAPPDYPGSRDETFIAGTESRELVKEARAPSAFGLDDTR